MVLVVQVPVSVLHNDALGFSRDIRRCKESDASGSVGGAILNKGLVVFMVVCSIGIS